MKEKKKEKGVFIKLPAELYRQVSLYCITNDMKRRDFFILALREKLLKNKKY
jgi:hypothetical protein